MFPRKNTVTLKEVERNVWSEIIISLATARLVGRGIIAHQSSFSVSAVLLTTLGFLMIQVVALFILCGKLFNKEIHQLLYGEMAKKQQVGKMSGNLFSLILGAGHSCGLLHSDWKVQYRHFPEKYPFPFWFRSLFP